MSAESEDAINESRLESLKQDHEDKPRIELPTIGSRWMRNTPHDPNIGPYNGYMILFITNIAHPHPAHPPQVVYIGDNGLHWSIPLRRWPGKLVPETKES